MCGVFEVWKMRVNKRFSMAVVPVVNVNERRGNQCQKHGYDRHTCAESMHGQSFSCTEPTEVNRMRVCFVETMSHRNYFSLKTFDFHRTSNVRVAHLDS